MSEFDLAEFVEEPTAEMLGTCTTKQLFQIAGHYLIEVSKTGRKDNILAQIKQGLIALEVFTEDMFSKEELVPVQPLSLSSASAIPADRVKVLELELKLQELKVRELELTSQQKAETERLKLELERDRLRFQAQEKSEKLEADKFIRLKELEIGVSRPTGSHGIPTGFDVSRNIRLVPPFKETEVDKYFPHFERVATSLGWPKKVWTLLLQCVLTGKAQKVYSSLTPEEGLDFDIVKSAILRSYELVPEAYRQKFRSLRDKKSEGQTWVEFASVLEGHFDRWCLSLKVDDFINLRSMMILEEFKNCCPEVVSTYLNEKSVREVSKAAILADEFVITHKKSFVDKPTVRSDKGASASLRTSFSDYSKQSSDYSKQSFGFPKSGNNQGETDRKDRPVCSYCKKLGHSMINCYALKRKNGKPTGLVSTAIPSSLLQTNSSQPRVENVMDDYTPFFIHGWVSLTADSETRVPVKVLRDTGAAQSLVLKSVLPFSDTTALGSSVLLQGIEMGCEPAPLHSVHINTPLVTGQVVVALRPSLPFEGISVILGNDLAGGRILAHPRVTLVPIVETPDELTQRYPQVFPACAVTRAMSKRLQEDVPCILTETKQPIAVELSETFMHDLESTVSKPKEDETYVSVCDVPPRLESFTKAEKMEPVVTQVSVGDITVPREHLKAEQRKDPSLSPLFEESSENISEMATGYFLSDGILMRKWCPPSVSLQDEWCHVFQVAVPTMFRPEILKMAHDGTMAGHLGVNKTYDRILRNFFWPGLKKDVVAYCKSCHICQLAGKPNQTIPVSPLLPIPAFDQPFSRVLVDCVGPLPKTKSGNKFLLTIMCASTRFPEAVPLRTITARTVLKHLVKFFTLVGLPKTVQSDQGSNFMSKVFKQVLEQLGVSHCHSSAYHPESQGALERFHQTLKSMLRAYSLEFKKDWDEGVPLMLFAIREVVQESLGFSPAELVFAHTVRGPLKLLQEKWLADDSPPQNLLDYVCQFRHRLSKACEIAGTNLQASQRRMKSWYDKKAKTRAFAPGDKVLVFLPLPGSSLQARYSGPYTVLRKVNDLDYVIATPDRRKGSRMCHINMLKEYCSRVNAATPETEPQVPVLTCVPTEDDSVVEEFGSCVPGRRLNNTEVLADLDGYLSHLPDMERAALSDLLRSHVSLFPDDPSQTTLITHDIDVGDALPVKQHPYRVGPEKRALLQKEVAYMTEHGIAEPSFSAWSSPCILVPKPDGTHRFCTDYRKVNALTKVDSFPLPRMDDCVDRVGAAKFVSKLDLLKGYWQVPLSDRAREISAFVTPDGLWSYSVMAFGMRNAPSTFQRLVNRVLSGLPNCEAYLDDLVVYSSSWEEHLTQLAAVLGRLSHANLTVNLAKCEFVKATVTYLGKIVGQGQVRSVRAKVEAIDNFPIPHDRKALRRFLGMAGYYRSFCRNFSSVVSPLTTLLSPKIPFLWTPDCQQAFEGAKSLLVTTPVLAAPDFSRPFKLAVDASDTGAGAVLLQDNPDGVELPVCFFSRKFNKHQKNYAVVEKEALALILAVTHFEVYLCGSEPILVYTDHNPLVFLQRIGKTNQRLRRWSLALQSFPLVIQHIRGRDNLLADALSRA